jgi:hypothetical protein
VNRPGLFSAVVVVLGVAHGQAVKDPVGLNPVLVSSRVQVIASLERARPKLGEPIILHYHLKNVSSQAIMLRYAGTYDSWVMVTDALGRELPLTKEGRAWRGPPSPGSSVRGSLEPGAVDGDQAFDLTKLYQLDRPGDYFVRIARRMGTPPDVPSPKTPQEMARTPLEEAVSDLIPFSITP